MLYLSKTAPITTVFKNKKSNFSQSAAKEHIRETHQIHFCGNKKRKIAKKVIEWSAIAAIAINLSHCSKTIKPPEYSLNIIEKQANDILHNFKFEKADLIYDIGNILKGGKLSSDSVRLYMDTVSSPQYQVYMSENAGQMMNVLAIAANSESNKDQITPEKLKPLLIKALQYDKGSILNELPDAVTGDGEPWHYVAASMLIKNHPNLSEHMPNAEKEALMKRGFIESVSDDVKEFFGKKQPPQQYLGDIIEQRDNDYKLSILSNHNAGPWLPSDNDWFGPSAVGYAVRGNLDNLKGMTPEHIEEFRTNYVKDDANHLKFLQDSEYREKVISSYIVYNLNEAINENSGKVNSGLSALALKEGGLLTETTSNKLLHQVSEEIPRMHLLNNETKKLDAAIKTYTIATVDKYELLAPETRASIRKFEVENPKSTATSVFKLAEDYYLRSLNKKITNHDTLQTNAYIEIVKPDKNKSVNAIKSTSETLKEFDSSILNSIKHEIEVEQLADPKGGRIKSLQNMKNNLSAQLEQLNTNLTQVENLKKINLQKELTSEPNVFEKIQQKIGQTVESGEDALKNSAGKYIKSLFSKDN